MLAIKHKDSYGANPSRKKIAESQLSMIDTLLKKRKRNNPSVTVEPVRELDTCEMWNTRKSPKMPCMGHIHNRKMFLAYAELLKLEKREKRIRNEGNYFAEQWGQIDSYVARRSPMQRYELPPVKIKKKMRNSKLNKSVDIRMHQKKSRKRSTSMHDEELERAKERIRTIEMISLLREEKLKVEF